MIKKILLVFVVLIVVVVGVSYLLPGDYEVKRSTSITASPEAILVVVADLNTWPEWTAWSREADPECKWTYSGAPTGAGSKTAWEGPKLGQGELELKKADATGVKFTISFEGGAMLGNGTVRFQPDGANTEVTWTARGALGKNPVLRYMGLMMDSYLGPDLEKSLAGLKSRVEAVEPPTEDPDPADPTAENGPTEDD